MFLIEVEAFINAIKVRKLDAIQSLYEDLALSYQATQWITTASSENRHQKTDIRNQIITLGLNGKTSIQWQLLDMPLCWSDGAQLAFPHRKSPITLDLCKAEPKCKGDE